MSTLSATVPGHQLWKSTLLSGAATIILGVVVFLWPQATILVAAALFGVYLLVSGVMQVVFAFGLPLSSAGSRVLMFLSGAASVVLAVLCFRSLADSVLLLAIWIGIGFVFRGVSLVVAGFEDKSVPGRGWVIVSGVLSLLAGLVLLAYPFPSLQVLTIVVATWLVIIGVTEVVAAVQARRALT